MSGPGRTRHRFRRLIHLVVACVTAATVAACSSGGTTAGNSGSATSGTVNWWGWSPSAQAAKATIAGPVDDATYTSQLARMSSAYLLTDGQPPAR